MPSGRRLTDEQLASADLRIADPTVVENYTRDRPDPNLTPEIIGEYDLTPPGGLAANPDGPWIWCCHCQKANHWHGFVVGNSTGQRFSIGKDCAANHYGVEFVGARRTFKDEVARKGLLERLKAARGSAAMIEDAVTSILHSPGLAAIDAKRQEIEKTAANAAFLLAVAVQNGSQLFEEVRVRDHAAERARDDRLPENAERPSIYTFERRALGQVEGAALVRKEDDCRDRLLRLRRSLAQVTGLYRGDTNAAPTATLKTLAVEVETGHRAALDGLEECARAHTFFSATNGDRLARWSRSHSDFTIDWSDEGLEFRSKNGEATLIEPLSAVDLPHLPPVRNLKEPT